ncbi:succinate--CoA ligase subunit beta [Geitlerinema sp. CS-897]|nr:succinate--CoA ligase subunit beta [Geitlerinema sp. CS-897]
MDLLEYQAKELFRETGIPVLPSQKIRHPQDLKGLKIPYPVVLKSQVRVGGRGKAGGVRFAANTIDAIAAAQAIFHLPIQEEYPDVLLAEAKYNADREFYLAILLDRSARRPVLLGSPYGGVEVNFDRDTMQRVVVKEDFSPFYARRLALKMGLRGEAIEAVSAIVENMYQLFVQKDLDLVEINPLGIRDTGEVMALDGKITVNDEALSRHEDLARLVHESHLDSELSSETAFLNTEYVSLDGNIAIVCNGAGLTMSTLDLVCQAKGKPANFLNLGSELCWREAKLPLKERLKIGLERVTKASRVNVVLVNLILGVTSCKDIVDTLIEVSERKQSDRTYRWIVRPIGSDCDIAQKAFADTDITVLENLDEAVALAVKAKK